MNLRTKCDEFLQTVMAMRDTAIQQAVQQELQTKHEPYRVQLISARDKILANQEEAYRVEIERITKEYEAQKSACIADFDNAVKANRNEVARTAEANAKVEYDKFILGVSAVADDIKVN